MHVLLENNCCRSDKNTATLLKLFCSERSHVGQLYSYGMLSVTIPGFKESKQLLHTMWDKNLEAIYSSDVTVSISNEMINSTYKNLSLHSCNMCSNTDTLELTFKARMVTVVPQKEYGDE